MILVRFAYKLSIIFLCFSLIFFVFSLIEVTTHATVFAPNTFISNFRNQNDDGQEGLSQSISADYLKNANSVKVFDEFTEKTIDPNGFYLRIDSIDLFKAVVKDVDPRYKDIYVKSWEKGISHGKFTAYPDQIGITYLYSHALGNVDYATEENAWFSKMDQVKIGDSVVIYYQGIKYIYEVNEQKAVSPDATGFYTGSSSVAMVRMQYCGPPTGSLAKRTLVDALLIDQEPI